MKSEKNFEWSATKYTQIDFKKKYIIKWPRTTLCLWRSDALFIACQIAKNELSEALNKYVYFSIWARIQERKMEKGKKLWVNEIATGIQNPNQNATTILMHETWEQKKNKEHANWHIPSDKQINNETEKKIK